MQPYMISYTQKEAGFQSEIKERFLNVDIDPYIYAMCEELKRERVIEMDGELIL